MRPLKRLLVFVVEVGSLLLGLILSAVCAVVVERMFGFEPGTHELGRAVSLAILFAGLVLTVVAFWAIRRRTRPWKTEYDAVGWELTQAERKLHPSRARLRRLAMRILVWAPSLLAFVVLFFFPAASHVIRPGTQTVGPYRLYIPWTIAIVPVPEVPADSFILAFALVGSDGGFGVTPVWRGEVFSSEMGFGSLKADPKVQAGRQNMKRRDALEPLNYSAKNSI